MAAPEENTEEKSPESGEEDGPHGRREFLVLLARDVAFAVILVAIFLAVIFAYTQVWPPMVVVESGSMRHSNSESFIGVIETGDLVLVQAVRQPSDLVTYVEGRASGHETYSNYGDVIIFHPPGAPLSATPIIHRAIVYVVPRGAGQGVDVPSLALLPRDEWTGTWAANGSVATTPYGLADFTLKVRSWDSGSATLRNIDSGSLTSVSTAGFLTKGDHNSGFDGSGPVAVSRIIGKARGELPWFGLIRLTLSPTGECCFRGWGDPAAPKNSWDSLAATLILIPVSVFLIDFGYSFAEKRWKEYRARKKGAEHALPEGEPPAGPDDGTPSSPEPTPPVPDEAAEPPDNEAR